MKNFEYYKKNLAVLRRSDKQDLSNEFILSGIFRIFAIQFELAWKVLAGVSVLSLYSRRCVVGYAVAAQ